MRTIALAVAFACGGAAHGNPLGPKVAAGAAAFQTNGNTLTVTNAPGTIINWNGFSIGVGEVTKFQQQSAASAVLNRVVGADPSSILGTLWSNGRVFLVNPNGIVVGPSGRIDTAGFVASTLNISDADFLNGKLNFAGGGQGLLRNEGQIRASGDIMLVGPKIENVGLIRSENGSVLLAAGKQVTITSPDAQGVRFELQAPTDSALNIGTIEAKSAIAMFAGTLKHSGDIRAGAATMVDAGTVILSAQSDAIVYGNATITAAGAGGGTVHVLGERVALTDHASIDTSGETGGGTILVGGDFRGANPLVKNASQTYVGPDVRLRADARSAGNGGKVVVWADHIARYYGSISARGGALSGNGGNVEVSGKGFLDFRGIVDTRAPNGQAGTLLLDPTDLIIFDPTLGLAPQLPPGQVPSDPFSIFFTEMFTGAPPLRSSISTADLATALNGNNVTLDTTSLATAAGDITFTSAFNWTPAAPAFRTLTLNANNDVNINAPITYGAGGTAAGLNLVTNTGGVTNLRADLTLGAIGSINTTVGGGSGILNVIAGSGGTVKVAGGITTGQLNLLSGTLAQGAEAQFTASAVRLASGTTLNTGNIDLIIGVGGVLGGSGTVTTGLQGRVINNGQVQPGAGPGGLDPNGTLSIFGGFTQNESGSTNVVLTDATTFTKLNVSGDATLAGTLGVNLAPGFNAPAGTTFNVATYLTRQGDFTTIAGPQRPIFIGLPGPAIYQLLQTNSALLPTATGLTGAALQLARETQTTLNTNSLLTLNDSSLIMVTPQGLVIGGNKQNLPVCQ